jgi:hypothetical protein
MARSIAEIKAQILTEKAAQSSLSGLTSTSQTSIFNLWSYITAVAIYIQEGLWDLFKSDLETIIDKAPVGTNQWVQDQVFKFQYDVTTPQIVTMNNFVPAYNPVNTTKQLISRASVKTQSSSLVTVKVAKSNPPAALTSQELTSLIGYMDIIGFAGVNYNTVSYDPDQVYINATVYYDGQYASSITGDTLSAIDTYFANIPFDGFVKNSKIEDALQSVQGVNDVVLSNVAIRPYYIPFSGTTYLIQNNTENIRQYTMYGGYAVTETTSGYTINDSINFIVG